MSNYDFIRRICSSSRTDRDLTAPDKDHEREGTGDIFQWMLRLPYAATATRKNFLHIAGHPLYNIAVGGFRKDIRTGGGRMLRNAASGLIKKPSKKSNHF
ncbi:MAG: hypothetical protein V1721_04905 [Pseudomonadota bacterium]